MFVCVHGLGGSHVNWALLAPRLARHGAVHAPDLAGFGLTPPTGRRPTVADNVDLLAGYIRTVSPLTRPEEVVWEERPVVLLGNSMGGLIALLLAAARPRLVSALVLVAPASPRRVTAPLDPRVFVNFAAMAMPGVGERVLARRQQRLTPTEQVRETMLLSVADPEALDPEIFDEHVEMARQRRELPYARAALLQAARSMLITIGPRARTLWQAVEDVSAPTLLLHGSRDRLVTAGGIAAVARRRPDWTTISYDDLGHIPMLEAPHRLADDIEQWMSTLTLTERVRS